MSVVTADTDATGCVKDETGGCIETRSGRRVSICNPDPKDMINSDIVFALSKQCRYAGHTRVFYSVAEHSCLVHDLMLRKYDWFNVPGMSINEVAFAGLMHDASEAYLVDVPRPLKLLMPRYVELETGVMHAIRRRYNMADSTELHAAIKRADNLVLRVEAEYLMASKGEDWGWTSETPLLDCIELGLWPSDVAAYEMLSRICRYRDSDA